MFTDTDTDADADDDDRIGSFSATPIEPKMEYKSTAVYDASFRSSPNDYMIM